MDGSTQPGPTESTAGWQQGRPHRGADVVLIPLHKGEHAEVPDDGQHTPFVTESQEVVYKRVHDAVRQCVLLVQQRLDHEACDAGVRQVGHPHQRLHAVTTRSAVSPGETAAGQAGGTGVHGGGCRWAVDYSADLWRCSRRARVGVFAGAPPQR